jgi:hypothetical protein
MPDLQHHPRTARRHKPVSAPVQKAAAMPVATPTDRPTAVQVHIGGRWIAGQAISWRIAPTGDREALISHHGHLVWVNQHQIREP